MLDVECFQLRLSCAIIILFASAAIGFAQSNGVPGPDDYAAFNRFITDRNIFDPSRVAHNIGQRTQIRTRTRTRSTGTPGIQLVGTMTYEKGPFAFFNANSSEYRKALQAGDKIAGYTITGIGADSVALESADKKTQLELKVGDGLVQQGTKWALAKAGALPVVVSAPDATSNSSSPADESLTATPATTAPASVNEPNDVLKRLMQQREKENQ